MRSYTDKQYKNDYLLKYRNNMLNKPQYHETLFSTISNAVGNMADFRQQVIHKRFILDFYSDKAKLAIEIDGEYHNTLEQRVKDRERTIELQKDGIEVMRVTNKELDENFFAVIDRIQRKYFSRLTFNQIYNIMRNSDGRRAQEVLREKYGADAERKVWNGGYDKNRIGYKLFFTFAKKVRH